MDLRRSESWGCPSCHAVRCQRGHVLWSELEQPCRLVLQSRIAMNMVLLLLRKGGFERRKLAKTCYHKHNLNFPFLSHTVENMFSVVSGGYVLASVAESQRFIICSSLGFQGFSFNSRCSHELLILYVQKFWFSVMAKIVATLLDMHSSWNVASVIQLLQG